MFSKGAYVIHGSNGVCRVDDIGPLSGMGAGGKDYYTLTPVYSNGGKIFSPVDNTRIVLRPVLSREEAEGLLRRLNDFDELEIADEKKREDVYKQAFYSGECENLVRMLKAIRARGELRMSQGKRATASDERYLHMAEDVLFGELAISFGISRDEAKDVFVNRFEQNGKDSAT
ncbi:MAG: CarD family transcriptional regulator [Lachnospiraceae bacterium]|nr:CarD family transcriptional regulator [Lachnospiraceae bacterium]